MKPIIIIILCIRKNGLIDINFGRPKCVWFTIRPWSSSIVDRLLWRAPCVVFIMRTGWFFRRDAHRLFWSRNYLKLNFFMLMSSLKPCFHNFFFNTTISMSCGSTVFYFSNRYASFSVRHIIGVLFSYILMSRNQNSNKKFLNYSNNY